MNQTYTALIQKSKLEYVAVFLEINLTARGGDLAELEKNLKNVIEAYLEDVKKYPETVVSPISIDELIEFLTDTEPDWIKERKFIRPLEVHEVVSKPKRKEFIDMLEKNISFYMFSHLKFMALRINHLSNNRDSSVALASGIGIKKLASSFAHGKSGKNWKTNNF